MDIDLTIDGESRGQKRCQVPHEEPTLSDLMQELRLLRETMQCLPEISARVNQHETRLKALETKFARFEQMPDAMTTLSASTADGEFPLLLAGGWENKEQAMAGQQVLMGLNEPIVESWVSAAEKPTLFVKLPSVQARLKLRLAASQALKAAYPSVYLKDGRSAQAEMELKKAKAVATVLQKTLDKQYELKTKPKEAVVVAINRTDNSETRLCRFNQGKERWNWDAIKRITNAVQTERLARKTFAKLELQQTAGDIACQNSKPINYYVAAVVETSSASSSGKPSGRAMSGFSTDDGGGYSCVRPVLYEKWPIDAWSLAGPELCALASALENILELPTCEVVEVVMSEGAPGLALALSQNPSFEKLGVERVQALIRMVQDR
eukprot:5915087-Amphidinium_carterae.1